MLQAACSGNQNILEGGKASGASKEDEIKLTDVARVSLEELFEDYRDSLRQNGRPQSAKYSKKHAPPANGEAPPPFPMKPSAFSLKPAPAMLN